MTATKSCSSCGAYVVEARYVGRELVLDAAPIGGDGPTKPPAGGDCYTLERGVAAAVPTHYATTSPMHRRHRCARPTA